MEGGLVESTPITPGNIRVGSQFRETIKDGDTSVDWTVEVTEYDPEKSVTLSMTSNEVDCQVKYDLSLGRSTRKSSIRYYLDYQFHHWKWKLLEPVAGHLTRERVEKDLERLKTNLEFGGAAAARDPLIQPAAPARSFDLAFSRRVFVCQMTSRANTWNAGEG